MAILSTVLHFRPATCVPAWWNNYILSPSPWLAIRSLLDCSRRHPLYCYFNRPLSCITAFSTTWTNVRPCLSCFRPYRQRQQILIVVPNPMQPVPPTPPPPPIVTAVRIITTAAAVRRAMRMQRETVRHQWRRSQSPSTAWRRWSSGRSGRAARGSIFRRIRSCPRYGHSMVSCQLYGVAYISGEGLEKPWNSVKWKKCSSTTGS